MRGPSSLLSVVVLAAGFTACGGQKTTGPSSAGNTSVDWTVSGTLVSTVDGQPVAGATLSPAGGSDVRTDAAGRFSIGGPTSQVGPLRIVASATGFVTRVTYVNAGSTRGGVQIDLIRDAPPFSAERYREMAHGSLDGAIAGIRRWSQDARFYVRTIDENGAQVPQWMLDTAMAVIPDIVLDATASRFHAVSVEAGTNTAPPAAGTILVTFPAASFGAAGRATGIGVSPCTVQVWQGDVVSAVPGVIAHEIGHCLGLSHITVTGVPPTATGLMGKAGPGAWNLPRLTDVEKHLAAIIYSRPIGNGDPDNDPASWLFSRTGGAQSGADWVY